MTSFVFVYSILLIMVFSKEDKILIKTLRELKGFTVRAKRFIKEFPDKNWNRRGLDYLHETGTVERTIGSGRRRSSRNIDAVEDLR